MKRFVPKSNYFVIFIVIALLPALSFSQDVIIEEQFEAVSDSSLVDSTVVLPDSSISDIQIYNNLFETMEFVPIPSGTFMMGSSDADPGIEDDESPRHSVSIDAFEMMTTEVTQGMWEALMFTDLRYLRDEKGLSMELTEGDNFPVHFVTWENCQEFIEKLNSIDHNYTYRLPTESEWEYACRAGSRTLFYWGDETDSFYVKEYCWYLLNSDTSVWTMPHAEFEGVQPVAELTPNEWGLFDMSGNVWEWCQDTIHDSYQGAPSDGSAWISDGSGHIARGGSWKTYVTTCRSANRGRDYVAYRYLFIDTGFRLVRVTD